MSDLVNLNKFRKQKARAQKRQRADENAVRFGRSKAAKSLEEARAEKARALLEGHRVEPPKDTP